MNRVSETWKHRRSVRVSVVLPAVVELIVGTNDDPSEDSDWQIVSVQSASCEATKRLVEENMHNVDFEAMCALAASAKDLP